MTTSRRHNRSRRGTPRTPLMSRIWPVAVIALVLFTGLLIVKFVSSRDARAENRPAAAGSAAAPHYDNLEIAEYAAAPSSPRRHVDYEGFTLSFNPANHTPDWVGWELLGSEASGNVSRTNNFWQDTDVAGCPSPYDYKNSGYDKGHLCPAADQKWSREAMLDCFVMTNMAPQEHALNAGAWQTLEKKERLWAERDSAIVIVAGPIYTDADTARIGDTGVRVPSAFYKVLLAPYVESPRAIGFIYPNMTSPGNMENYALTVDEVEEITGLDFFSSLPDEIENKVESIKSFTEWNRR